MAENLGFELTELRLGLPGGGGGDGEAARSYSGKRGFAETIDLKLKLEPAAAAVDGKEEAADREKKVDVVGADNDDASPAVAAGGGGGIKRSPSQSRVVTAAAQLPDPDKPRAPKAQVVGWPPVRSYRKNILAVQAEKGKDVDGGDKSNAAAFVKVSMDGAPYLRKVDLKMYKSYLELSKALEKMKLWISRGEQHEREQDC